MPKANRNILLAFVFAFIVVVAISAYAVSQAIENVYQNERARKSRQYILALESIQVSLFQIETAARAFALTGEKIFLEEYEQFRANLSRDLTNFENTQTASANQEKLEQLKALFRERISLLEMLIDRRQSEGLEAAAALVATRKGKILMDRIRGHIQVMEQSELEQLETTHHDVIANARSIIIIFTAGAILNLVLLLAAFIGLRHELRRGARLVEQLQYTTREITLTNQFNNSLQSCETHREAGQVIQHYMQLLFPNTQGALYIMRSSRNLLELSSTWNVDTAKAFMDLIEPQDCWGLRLGKIYHVSNVLNDLVCSHADKQTVGHYVCIPMMAQGEIVGLLHLQLDEQSEQESILELGEILASQIASALANISLREALQIQNIRDPLTNLYNRRYLEETMERELLRAKRQQSSLGVIIIDIDHFKSFNDNHGHQAGDELLKVFADYLRRNIRGEDIACRYGGEEFILIMPGADLEKTRERAEELRLGMHNLHAALRHEELPAVTASFGVASYPLHADTWGETIKQADMALYKAKGTGRDRVMVAGDA